jgi:hypothetical protein
LQIFRSSEGGVCTRKTTEENPFVKLFFAGNTTKWVVRFQEQILNGLIQKNRMQREEKKS